MKVITKNLNIEKPLKIYEKKGSNVKFVTKYLNEEFPLEINDYEKKGGFTGLKKALNMKSSEIIELVNESNLYGRGGATFPVGIKWRIVANQQDEIKYVICNADEGEPGTFKDRVLLNGSPFQIIEGMIIAGYAVGSNKGYIYIRGEYPDTQDLIAVALKLMEVNNYLGKNILGTGFDFDIEIRTGAGAYICGEETALIESIEGNPGRSRFKPPYPSEAGLWGKPTLVNNVETLANIPLLLEVGLEDFKKYGTEGSVGTKVISVSGSVNNTGVFEVEFGKTIREIIEEECGGIKEGKTLKFVQVGGSSGACINGDELDIPLCFEEYKKEGLGIGSGAVLVVDDTVDIRKFCRVTMKFFDHESCGKCTPCREGNRQLLVLFDRVIAGEANSVDYENIIRITDIMKEASLCGLGQTAPTAITTLVNHFKDELFMEVE